MSTAQLQLANEYTLGEIADLRPGSSIIAIDNGAATITLEIEESADLVEWNTVTTTSGTVVPADDTCKFFRFKMVE